MSYDIDCDQSRGCYQVIENKDNVSKTSNVGYVIGQDNDGKAIETYSESYIDGQLVSKQETDYSLSQRLLENRTYTGNDQHLLAIKDYEYDVYERTLKEVVENYEDSGKVYQTNVLLHHYDDFNLDKETQSELTSDKPGDYKSYATQYDVLGRAVSRAYEVDGRHYQTSSQYDGADRGVLGSDFNANVNASVYDDNGHLAQMVSYKDGVTTTGNLQASNDVEVINYEYDNYSRLIQHSLNGNALGYDFDAIGLETGFSITNTVNSNGNLKASNNSENITYDEYNRVKSYNDYNNITYTVHYKPDSEVDYIEMQSSSSNLSGTLSSDKYEYDASVPYWLKGRVHSQRIDVNQNGHHQVNVTTKDYYAPDAVKYEVNIGQLKSVNYQVTQDGRSVEDLTIAYTYDDQGRVLTESYLSRSNPSDTTDDHSENNLNKVISYDYDPLNRLTKSETTFTSANKQVGDITNQVEAYSYNINGDITQHITTKTNQDGSQTVVTNVYTYNDINQLLQRTETTEENGQTTQVQFDYIYDENGNTIAVDEIKNNQATRIYEYDYNGLNQMVGFTNVQNNEYYGYDYYPNGKRSSKYTSSQTGTESIEFLYGHNGNLLNAEYSQNSQLQKRSSYFAGIRFVDDLINSNDSIFQLPLADRHNHPATISFSQGQSQIQSYHLTDYGQLSQSNTNNNTNGNVSNNGPLIDFSLNPKVYGSGYYDPESKLQYMGARYYSADSHRFMAQDSYNLLNRYNYANANPVMNYDPSGHSAVGDFAKGIANGFIPHGAKGWGALGASVVADVAITGALLASAAAPGIGTMTLIGALSGGASNAFGVAVGNVISGDQQNAYDLASQAVLGAAIGGLVSFSGTYSEEFSFKKIDEGFELNLKTLKLSEEQERQVLMAVKVPKNDWYNQKTLVSNAEHQTIDKYGDYSDRPLVDSVEGYVQKARHNAQDLSMDGEVGHMDNRIVGFTAQDYSELTEQEASLLGALRNVMWNQVENGTVKAMDVNMADTFIREQAQNKVKYFNGLRSNVEYKKKVYDLVIEMGYFDHSNKVKQLFISNHGL